MGAWTDNFWAMLGRKKKKNSNDVARERLLSVLQMDRAAVNLLSINVNFDAMCADLADVVARHLHMTPKDVVIDYTKGENRVFFEAGLRESRRGE